MGGNEHIHKIKKLCIQCSNQCLGLVVSFMGGGGRGLKIICTCIIIKDDYYYKEVWNENKYIYVVSFYCCEWRTSALNLATCAI